VGLGWGLSAETGPVIAKKPKLTAAQTNIAASVFLNSVELQIRFEMDGMFAI